jgi:hypothetical protein
MAEAGSYLMAEVMLWLMYIAIFVAVVAVVVSATRSFWMDNHKNHV